MQGEGTHVVAGGLGQRAGGVQQLGDAEIEQPHLALRIDQDVGGLEVAVHHQVGVGMADRAADLQEQAQAFVQRQLQAPAVFGDRLALDVGQHQVGLAVLAEAGIQQPGDVRMLQPRQDLALAVEALAQARVGVARVQQLQRHLPPVQPVGTLGQPHLAHAALAQRAQQAVGTGMRVGVPAARVRLHQRRGHEILAVVFQRQQLAQLSGGLGIVGLQLRQAALALFGREFEQFVKQRRQTLPALGVHARQLSRSDAIRNSRAFCQSRRMLRSERCISSAISASPSPAK